jgi:hypothetical protein
MIEVVVLGQTLPVAGKLTGKQGANLRKRKTNPQSRILGVVVIEDPQDLFDDLLRITGVDKLS